MDLGTVSDTAGDSYSTTLLRAYALCTTKMRGHRCVRGSHHDIVSIRLVSLQKKTKIYSGIFTNFAFATILLLLLVVLVGGAAHFQAQGRCSALHGSVKGRDFFGLVSAWG